MNALKPLTITILLSVGLLWGCTSKSQRNSEQNNVILGKLELSDGWARPATKGQNSAAYLTISNGTASADTLLEASSTMAAKAELHRSQQNEDGTTSMLPASQQIIASGDDLALKPGGLHLMLMDMKRDFSVGDTLSVTLRFARVGEKSLAVPIKLQQ